MAGIQIFQIWLAVTIGVTTLIGVTVGLGRWGRPRLREMQKDVRSARDVVLGRDAVIDTITGRTLAPAVSSLGQRIAGIEDTHLEHTQQMKTLAGAVSVLAESTSRVELLETRVGTLEAKEHERLLARTESIELLRTIDTAIRTNPAGED